MTLGKSVTLNTHSIYTFVLNKLHKVFKRSSNFKNKKGVVLEKDLYYSMLPLRHKISSIKYKYCRNA